MTTLNRMAAVVRQAASGYALRALPHNERLTPLAGTQPDGRMERVFERAIVGRDGWFVQTVNLGRFQGNVVTVQFEAHASGWSFEYAGLGRFSFSGFDAAPQYQAQPAPATAKQSPPRSSPPAERPTSPMPTPQDRVGMTYTSSSGATMRLDRCEGDPLVVVGLPNRPDLKPLAKTGSDKGLDATDGIFPLLREAYDFIGGNCAKRSGWNAQTVYLFSGTVPATESVAQTDPRQFIKATWFSPGRVWRVTNSPADLQRQDDEAKRQKETVQAQNAVLQSARGEAERNQAAFYSKYGVSDYVDANALQTNPFAFEGKPVLVRVYLDQMTSPSTAVMTGQGRRRLGSITVSDVPRGAFEGGVDYLVVGRVIGSAKVEGSMSPMSPHLKFVAAVRCKATTDRVDCF